MRQREASRVIRVRIPLDIGTISATSSCAFALATPLRVDRLLALAIGEALGARAPQDKRERNIRTALDGFVSGRFVVDIDGRTYDRPDSVVVCAGTAMLRFFCAERRPRSLPGRELAG